LWKKKDLKISLNISILSLSLLEIKCFNFTLVHLSPKSPERLTGRNSDKFIVIRGWWHSCFLWNAAFVGRAIFTSEIPVACLTNFRDSRCVQRHAGARQRPFQPTGGLFSH
jgi:hypothetical protein